MLIFISFFFLSSALANEAIYNIIRNKLNTKVRPCDNFSDHVCSNIKRTRDLISSQDTYSVEAMIEKHLPEEYFMFIRRADLDAALSRRNDLSHQEYVEFMLDRCYSKGSVERMIEEYNKLGIAVAANGTCIEMVMALGERLASIDPESAEGSIAHYKKDYGEIANVLAYYSYIEEQGQKFRDAEENVFAMFSKLKENLFDMLGETKWIRERGMLTVLQQDIASVLLYRWNHHSDMFRLVLTEIHAYYKDCTENIITGVRMTEILMCLKNAYGDAMSRLDSGAQVAFGILQPNARYRFWTRQVSILPTFYAGSDNGTITMHGKIGMVMAHELGHSLYASEELIDQCLVANAVKSCELFGKKECHAGKITQTEDAADWSGIRTSLDLIKNIEDNDGVNFADVANHATGLNLSSNQYFFYSFAAMFCDHQAGHVPDITKEWNSHTPTGVRINAGLRMFPEFHEAFKCEAGDPMFIEKDDLCYLAGPNAA